MGIAPFLIKRTLSHSFPHKYASTLAWEHPPGEGNRGNACLISNCSVPILVLSLLFSMRIKTNEF